MFLIADIGATKTRIGLFSRENGMVKNESTVLLYQNREFNSFGDLAGLFLKDYKRHLIEMAILAVAGPVINGQVTFLNLPWKMSETALEQELCIKKVKLINDLHALAFSIPLLKLNDLLPLKPGNAIKNATIAVLAPGTGLGEAFLVWDGTQYRAYATEGGHADFSPRNQIEIELLQFLLSKTNKPVCIEHVCSGIGIKNIYAFLKETNKAEDSLAKNPHIKTCIDVNPFIIEQALASTETDDICVQTIALFLSILGSEAGNLALKTLATGGVYIGGGVLPRILPLLEKSELIASFVNKSDLTSLLTDIPLSVIINQEAGLWGALNSDRN